MSRFLLHVFLVLAASGCATHLPSQPAGAWSNVNKTAPQVAAVNRSTPISISLDKAITQFAPPVYRLSIDPNIDMSTIIVYDRSKNWLEALAAGMSDASIEFSANLYKKTGTIRRSTITLSEAIDVLLPNDYTVFSEAGLHQDVPVYFDRRKHWIDALSNGAKDAGIDLKVDFTQKVIYLKPLGKFGSLSTSLSHK